MPLAPKTGTRDWKPEPLKWLACKFPCFVRQSGQRQTHVNLCLYISQWSYAPSLNRSVSIDTFPCWWLNFYIRVHLKSRSWWQQESACCRSATFPEWLRFSRFARDRNWRLLQFCAMATKNFKLPFVYGTKK